jgi:nicotinate (nicotinamide) nucleotide adenylyltransferase
MKIAIFGGSFNPVHRGHTELAKYIIENGVADQVLMMPCYKSLYNKGLESGEHRLNMIGVATIYSLGVEAFDWEIKNKIDGPGTYQIMQMLKQEFPNDELFFVIGLDNSQKVRKWKNGDKIVDDMKFIVVPRKGIEVTDNWFTKPPHIYLDKYEPIDISSTAVKNLLKNCTDTTNHLDSGVGAYILKHNLYKE